MLGCRSREPGRGQRGRDPVQAGEGYGEVTGPGPGAGQADPGAALAVGDPSGDVQNPGADLLGFGGDQTDVQERGLGPGEQVRSGQGELELDGVDGEDPGREPVVAVCPAGADSVLTQGVGVVAGFQSDELTGAGVGREGPESVAMHVGGRELGAGVGAFAANDDPQRFGHLLPVGSSP